MISYINMYPKAGANPVSSDRKLYWMAPVTKK